MPRALKACGTCGTPTPVTPCQDCAPTKPSGQHRDPTAKLVRTRRWRAIAARTIRAQPWCAWPSGCDLEIDDDNPLTVDHAIPRIIAPELTFDPTNLVVLCRRHNAAKGTRTLTPDGRLERDN